MGIIEFDHLTKDYGNNRGVFDVTLEINKGEAFGYLGPNGAGKTTSIRHLLGFLKPDSGEVRVNGLEVFANHYKTNPKIGYLPGEIAFPEKMTGAQLLAWNKELKGITDTARQDELTEYFELKHLNMKIARMSKGMKQKIGIICAFLGDPEILVLDEPTTGLDPLMQQKFINLVLEEKKKGKTIFMSTHIFQEVERTCDRVAIVRAGRIAEILNVNQVLHSDMKSFTFRLSEDLALESTDKFTITKVGELTYSISFDKKDTNEVLHYLSTLPVSDLEENKGSIEESFMKLYERKEEK